MTRTRLVLVRHGQTDWNASGRFQGQADVPLNTHGVAQAQELAPFVAALSPDRIVSSDLVRARVTAEVIGEASEVGIMVDEGLREIHVGSWQGRTPADVQDESPWFTEALRAGRDFRRSDTGETATEAGERVRVVLAALGEAYPGETTVVVGHGLALRVGLAFLLGLDFHQSFGLAGLWNCSWSVLEHRSGWALQSYNNVVPGHSGPLKSPNAP